MIEIAKILNCYIKEDKKIIIDVFFKELKFYMSNIFPDIRINTIDSRIDELNSVELHENLLLNSQNFKNYIDDAYFDQF